MSAAPPRARLEALTGARFFAAAAVVCMHYLTIPDHGLWAPLESLCRNGFAAVPFFFVLSGFVLAWNYPVDRPLDRRSFWVARFARIYPVYLVALLLCVPASAFLPMLSPHPGRMFAWEALLVQTVNPRWAINWNLPGWSISTEAFFYLAFPLASVLLPRRRPLLTLALLWMAGLLPPVLHSLFGPPLPPDLEDPSAAGTWARLVLVHPLSRLPEFLMGMVLGGIFRDDLSAGRRRNGLLYALPGTVALLGLLASGLPLPFEELHNALLAPLYALVVFGLAHGAGPLSAFLSSRPVAFLGESSYALYILQRPVRIFWQAAQRAPGMNTPRVGDFAAYFVVLVAVSGLVHLVFERPARTVLRARLARSRPPTVELPAAAADQNR